MTPEDLLNALDDLGNEDFTRFKWFLQQPDCLEGLPVIRKGRLQAANREDTVDLLVQTYTLPGALGVTREVLEKIHRNDLLHSLSVSSSEPEVHGRDDESSGSMAQASLTLPPREDVVVGAPEPHPIAFYQQMLQSNFQDKFMCAEEGWAEDKQRLVDVYTEVYVAAGRDVHINTQHEVRQIENVLKPAGETAVKPRDMFSHPSGEYQPIKTVLTNGIAGIGKTFLVQKFVLDWAERRSNQDVDLIFPFTFRQLNPLRAERLSLAQLIHECIPETVDIREEALNYIFKALQSSGNSNFDKSRFKLLFVFDGLDESRLHLDLHVDDVRPVDPTKTNTADVLLRNLISGKLLRSARIWITSRPAAANQIPGRFVSSVNEVRGFTDLQKETYFRKRFRGEEQAEQIVAHIQASRSLHIMCHIPVFCWIAATVLEDVLKTRGTAELPNSLTDMYTEFLVFQIHHTKQKYGSQTSLHYIRSLAKLAYQQLEKGNLIFYKKDLLESNVDFKEASVCSGVFTEIFKEVRGRKGKDEMFSFVHLSVQEFLAALYVRMSPSNSSKISFLPHKSIKTSPRMSKTISLKKTQVYINKALQSPNGHLDLFLRFFLGLSLETNQSKLQELLGKRCSCAETHQETVQYIKKKLSENLSLEKSLNLFHCLNELNDRSLVEDIQRHLSSGRLSTDKLSPVQWSALTFILLSSKHHLDEFELKQFSGSEEALLRLLPAVRASSRALLSGCSLSGRSCEALSSLLGCQKSSLTELDLSNNQLEDSGVRLLSTGLQSSHCKLEILRLSGCMITGEGCASLASSLTSNPSHLKELDLSYNHPGEEGVRLLRARLQDPCCRLESLSLEHCGERRMRPGLTKYLCELRLDLNSVSRKMKLLDVNMALGVREALPYPDHPDRFHSCQALSEEPLSGRCYWEAAWRGGVYVAVSYRGIRRKGIGPDSWFGWNDRSWSIFSSSCGAEHVVWHNRRRRVLRSSSLATKIGVYVDVPAGVLSFYSVCGDSQLHLHTVSAAFTEPLYAGFGFWSAGSSVAVSRL